MSLLTYGEDKYLLYRLSGEAQLDNSGRKTQAYWLIWEAGNNRTSHRISEPESMGYRQLPILNHLFANHILPSFNG